VREDAIALYGFKTEAEREMFLQLLTVKNIGPRIALTALAGLTPQDISQAVRHSNPMALVIPGIGPKTAERIVQELRGVLAPAAEAERAGPPLHGAAEEAVSALENMGCEPKRALEAVQAVLQSSEELAPSSSRAKKPALLVPSGIEGSGVEGSRDQIQSFEALMKGALQWLREKRR
jgi:Holliday junction DNA helicase RuvA